MSVVQGEVKVVKSGNRLSCVICYIFFDALMCGIKLKSGVLCLDPKAILPNAP